MARDYADLETVGDLNKRFMHDFSLIQDFEPWVYDQNAAFEKALVTKTEPDDVVVTHHMPRPRALRRGLRARASFARRRGRCRPTRSAAADPWPHFFSTAFNRRARGGTVGE